VPGLLIFIAFLGLAGAVSPFAGGLLERMANIVPLLIATCAAWRAALPDGAPVFRFTGYDPKAQRDSFRRNIWLYAITFGVIAVLTDLTMALIATLAGFAEGFQYSILRLWGIAGLCAIAAKFAIERSLTAPGAHGAEDLKKVEDVRDSADIAPEMWALRRRDQ